MRKDGDLGEHMEDFVASMGDLLAPMKALIDSFGQLRGVVSELQTIMRTFGQVTHRLSESFNSFIKMAGQSGGGGSAGGGGAAGGMSGASGLIGLAAENPYVAGAVVVIGAVVAALAALTYAAVEAGKAIRDNIGAQAMSGAKNIIEASQLHALAGGLGMSDTDLARRSRSFGDLLNGGGVPAAFANQLGINPYGGIGGDQDFFGKFKSALQQITNPNISEGRANQYARYFGMEDQMWTRYLSPQSRNMLFNDMDSQMTPEARRRAAEEQFALNRAMRDFMDVVRQIGTTVLPVITEAFRHFGDILDTIIRGVLAVIPGATAIYDASGAGKKVKDLNAPDHVRNAQDVHDSLNQNTKATQHLTDAMNRMIHQMAPGVYGGGAHFHGNGIPSKWNNATVNQAMQQKAIAMGAVSV